MKQSRAQRSTISNNDDTARPNCSPENHRRQRSGKSADGNAELRNGDVRSGIWDALRSRIGEQKVQWWFAHAELQVEGERVEVHTDTPFAAKWIESHFAGELRESAAELVGANAVVEVKVASKPALAPPHNGAVHHNGVSNGIADEDTAPASSYHQLERTKSAPFRKLSDFVIGPSNKLAYSAASRIAEDIDAHCISPLFIHGDCGVGKTHLLQGVCAKWIEATRRPQNVRYVTGEQFTNEYITAVRNNNLDAFRQKNRKLDLLAIDDVHFLSNKVRTQTEFLYTLDAIDLSGARVVLASDNHPHHIRKFNQALVSRFLSGMVVKIDRPDRETRLELLKRLAEARGICINPAALDLIATNCIGSVRELEGAITKLTAYHLMMNGHADESAEIGVMLAEQLFREQCWQQTRHVRIATIIELVCDRLSVTKADVLGSGRHRRVVLARSLIAYLGRELTTQSFPEIAQALGRGNHSTIHTADQRLRKQIADIQPLELGNGDPAISLKELIDQLRRSIMDSSKLHS